MRIRALWSLGLVFSLSVLTSSTAHAGPFTDDLSKCLVAATTTDDRTALVKWMFSAAALHPAVRSIANVSADQLAAANKATGELFMRLLTEACKAEAAKALKYEGQGTIEASFQVLGQVAGKELFSSPEVVQAMAGLEQHIDGERSAR